MTSFKHCFTILLATGLLIISSQKGNTRSLIDNGLSKCSDTIPISSLGDDPWTLVFEDQFDGDLSSWNIWEGGAYNEEIQMYTKDQLEVSNGTLKINVKREKVTGPITNKNQTPKDFEYVSGRIESKPLFGPTEAEGESQYRFVASIKLPAGHGMWPAFWTYGEPWPTEGEIDILEARGSEPNLFHSNIFYGEKPNQNINKDAVVSYDAETDLTLDFHSYEMIWKTDGIDILLDGTLLYSYEANSGNNIDKLIGKKQKVTLNTAVGGWFIKDRDSKNYTDQSQMEVDWVRVYKR